ncbi:hypothetical protein SAMN05421844_105136 [Bosea robiniae]|uniref:Uncharacterized protein n=2 Tax=Bosea robiniae TaxID=1036780 RepID=A0ABY0P7G0_9HYPH|nr:hypothetical protein SAMN05421844_105136 [Bosea robiniae]
MTLILEFERKLIFYKPGILRYAMRQAGPEFSAAQNQTQRRQLLSHSLKRGWAEARAELEAFQRLQALKPERHAEPSSHHTSFGAASSHTASPIASGYCRLH